MIDRFPIYKAGEIFNEFTGTINGDSHLILSSITINYPCRLDAMAIDPSAVCYNEDMIFTPGEVTVSIDLNIKVSIKVTDANGGNLSIGNNTKRKVLVKHAYLLMCKALNINPSLEIDVDSSSIPKHCGFGSSSSTITSVAVAINELYGNPIDKADLIKYLASNHGEEVSDDNDEDLKMVQSIGGGATGGLTDAGIIIIAGKATTIAKMKYEAEVLIAIPKDFEQKNANELMKLEEENLWKFKATGEQYANTIAYSLLHKAIPDMINGNIGNLAKVVFDYRFDMGSIENCSFVYEKMIDQAITLRKLYEMGRCELLSLSSVGPAYFVLVRKYNDKLFCRKVMEDLDMKVIETSICNDYYKIEDKTINISNIFWQRKETSKVFKDMKLSPYITDTIEKIIASDNHNINAIDIGCGAGRYANYLAEKNISVIAIDKYKEMYENNNNPNIKFMEADMSNIPFKNNMFNLVLSIGVLHNAESINDYKKSIKEIYRILKPKGILLISIFTNDVITDDLINMKDNYYEAKDRPPMVLFSKNDINTFFEKSGFKNLIFIDEHVTDVGSGKRNVYTFTAYKDE